MSLFLQRLSMWSPHNLATFRHITQDDHMTLTNRDLLWPREEKVYYKQGFSVRNIIIRINIIIVVITSTINNSNIKQYKEITDRRCLIMFDTSHLNTELRVVGTTVLPRRTTERQRLTTSSIMQHDSIAGPSCFNGSWSLVWAVKLSWQHIYISI